jgi:hypothetical protein
MHKQKLCFMLAVWGNSYVEQFFQRSLRTHTMVRQKFSFQVERQDG